MSTLGLYELTHPELLTESELRHVLKNSCIDFSRFEELSKNELIETYKRVALPLPQRQYENVQYLYGQIHENQQKGNYDSWSVKRSFSNITTSHPSQTERLKFCVNDHKSTPKKICLSTSKEEKESYGVEKRASDGRGDGAPTKKRQKITWP
ncbi:hypothetical protein KM043_011272 [Ampulex compressa]|nr:hypothetical protein KM043_011272 [Ampulex compressa]